MSNFNPANFPILFRDNCYNRTTKLAQTIADINVKDLLGEYQILRVCAPRRSDRNKRYFVGHDGIVSSSDGSRKSNRFEEHLAIAIWNLKEDWPHPGGDAFRILDYQFPLKAKQTDRGIGKVDLLGATDRGRLIVIELKVKPEKRSGRSDARGDTPLRALMEGLRYAAIVEANLDVIAREAKSCFSVGILKEPPIVQVLAPRAWWDGWTTDMVGSTRRAAGDWEGEFARFLQDIEREISVPVELMALDDIDAEAIGYGADGRKPTLGRKPGLHPFQVIDNVRRETHGDHDHRTALVRKRPTLRIRRGVARPRLHRQDGS